VTGYGQTGPDARAAGHDLNYLAVAGILHGLGDPDRPPPPPLAYLGDLGAGGTFAVIGVLAALLERGRSGCGQVVDAAVLDGAASLSAYAHGLASIGEWSSERGRNFADGSTPYYRCYATSDGGYVAVASIEPKFYSALLATLGMEPEDWPQQDRSRWPALRAQLERRFAERPRAHWAKQFDGAEACVTPVLELNEAPDHEHNRARGAFVATASGWTPAVAPRLTRTPSAPGELGRPGEHTDSILADLGYAPAAVAALRTAGAVG
jgi:alpha-methylacyl-CoA racemase